MRRLVVPSLVALLAVALVALLIFGVLQTNSSDTSIDEAVARGERPVAHDASLPVVDGDPLRLADFRGKVVVVNFFAHWCEPCKEEAPMLARAQREFASRGATLIGIASNDTTDQVRTFVRDYDVNYPVVSDVDGTFSAAYGVAGIPETFVLDRRGRIAALLRGPLKDDRWLKRTIERLLSERQSA